MLILVHIALHNLKTPFFLYLSHKRSVDSQVADRRGILVTPGRCSTTEIVVVGREQEEYSFTG